eukprot:4726716-Ditylum_brightwellii.AAC.1
MLIASGLICTCTDTKLHSKPAGYMEGTNEVHMPMDQLEYMVFGEKPKKKVKNVFTEKPDMCFSKYFSGDKATEKAGKRGFGLMSTIRHDCLPICPAEYLCKA